MRVPARLRFGLQGRLLTSVGATVVVAILAILWVATGRVTTAATAEAERYVDQLAQGHASALGGELSAATTSANDFAVALGNLSAAGADRPSVKALTRDLLDAHPELFGVWTTFAPDGYDGADAEFVGGDDPNGQFSTYWYRTEDGVGYDGVFDTGVWYTVPMETGKDLVMDPYTFELEGNDVLMTSLAAPVTAGEKLIGSAGVDFVLSDLQERVGQIRPFGAGYAMLVSTEDQVVAGPDSEWLTKPVAEVAPGLDVATPAAGDVVTVRGEDPVNAAESFISVAPINLGETGQWKLVVVSPVDKALASVASVRSGIILVGVVGIIVVLGLLTVIARKVTQPLGVLRDALRDIAEGDGDLTRRLDDSRTDEIGAVAAGFNRFVQRVHDMVAAIGSDATTLATSSHDMSATSSQLGSSAERTSAEASGVSAAIEQISASIGMVAAASEEMSSSISEISASSQTAATVAGDASTFAETTVSNMSKLGESSTQIGQAITLINAIAEQTNLLALNATIEANRAGDAGRGFAIVAAEVKELAAQTASATRQISQHVTAIQNDATGAEDSVAKILEVIGQVSDHQTAIAAAVEEQTSTTSEISRSVHEAAQSATDVSGRVAALARLADQTSSGAGMTDRSASALAEMAATLTERVGSFKVADRHAGS